MAALTEAAMLLVMWLCHPGPGDWTVGRGCSQRQLSCESQNYMGSESCLNFCLQAIQNDSGSLNLSKVFTGEMSVVHLSTVA